MSALQDIAMNLEAERVGHEPVQAPRPDTRSDRARLWFETLSIGSKVTLFFSLNLAFALVAGLFVVNGYIELGERAERVRSTHDQALKAERLLVQLSEGQRHAEMLMLQNGDLRARAARQSLDKAAATVAALGEVVSTSNM